jgi:O-antigen ligase
LRKGIRSVAKASAQLKEETGKPKKTLTFAYVGLLVFLIIYCGRPNDWIPGMSYFPFAKISAGVALLGLGLAFLGSGRTILKFPREVHLLFLLFFQMCLSVPFAIWRGGAFDTVFTEFSKVIPIFILIIVTATTVSRLRALVTVQTACVAIMAFLALSGHSRSVSLSNRSDLERLGGAVGGIYGNPNDFAWALAMAFPFAFALMLSAKNIVVRALWAAASVAMVIAVMQTMSRGGLIALSISATVTVWQYGVTGRRRHLLVLAAVGAVLLFLVAAPEGYLQRVVSSVDWAQDETGSAWGRKHLFMVSVRTTLEHPLFGIGPGNFEIVSGSWHGTHNTFTQFSSEAGIPAMLLYVALLWSSLRKLNKVRKVTLETDQAWILAGGMQAALMGLIVGGLFGMAAYLFATYFLLAFACALHMLTIRNVREGESIQPLAKKAAMAGAWWRRETVPAAPEPLPTVRPRLSPPLGHRRSGRLEN